MRLHPAGIELADLAIAGGGVAYTDHAAGRFEIILRCKQQPAIPIENTMTKKVAIRLALKFDWRR